MASDMSKYLGNQLARWLAGNDLDVAPAAIYAALFDGDPKVAGTEITTTIRAAGRVAYAPDTIAEDGVDNVLANVSDVDFGNSAGDATLSYVAIYDAATLGNLLFSKALTGGPFDVTTGTAVKFPAGDMTFTLGS